MVSSKAPLAHPQLEKIAQEACSSVFSDVTSYTHDSTNDWNTSIIQTILADIVKQASSTPGSTDTNGTMSHQPAWKFIVNSTIIQNRPGSHKESGLNGTSDVESAGKRGLHSAAGAYWDNERDGMWSYKYDAASAGIDVLVSVCWISTGEA
ncbi:hypothetical protein BT93_L0131 [Corymbia citriodora subsp. variegata]|uniref:Dynein light chain n=1 Tax=Corymbia citriodora subsp. variegata TaxID=360336 RepID=A0A8T0CES3_CORYI|nr:hypothetical protein BT93_L0131 [Corymbia citriodora subsp. variegata]